MKSSSLALLSVISTLLLAACGGQSGSQLIKDEVPYTAPTPDVKIEVGYVPPYPTDEPANEIEATELYNKGADAYAKCIVELRHAVGQDAVIRGAEQPKPIRNP